MIVAQRFSGDAHVWVMDLQHGLYMRSIGQLATEVCRVFCFACVVTESLPDLLSRLRRVEFAGVDHRILQPAHDHLAAHYRFIRHNWFHPELFGDSRESNGARVNNDWQDFWSNSVRLICDDASLLRVCAECIATTGGKNDPSKEDHLLQLVRQRFPL